MALQLSNEAMGVLTTAAFKNGIYNPAPLLAADNKLPEEQRDKVTAVVNKDPNAAAAKMVQAYKEDPDIIQKAQANPALAGKILGVELFKPAPATTPDKAPQTATPAAAPAPAAAVTPSGPIGQTPVPEPGFSTEEPQRAAPLPGGLPQAQPGPIEVAADVSARERVAQQQRAPDAPAPATVATPVPAATPRAIPSPGRTPDSPAVTADLNTRNGEIMGKLGGMKGFGEFMAEASKSDALSKVLTGADMDPAKKNKLLESVLKKAEDDPEFFNKAAKSLKDHPNMVDSMAEQFINDPDKALAMLDQQQNFEGMRGMLTDALSNISPQLAGFVNQIFDFISGFLPMLSGLAGSLGSLTGSAQKPGELMGASNNDFSLTRSIEKNGATVTKPDGTRFDIPAADKTRSPAVVVGPEEQVAKAGGPVPGPSPSPSAGG